MSEFVVFAVVMAVWWSLVISTCMLVTAWLRAQTSRMMPGASLAHADRNAASPSMDASIGIDGRSSAGVVDLGGLFTAAPAAPAIALLVAVVDSLIC